MKWAERCNTKKEAGRKCTQTYEVHIYIYILLVIFFALNIKLCDYLIGLPASPNEKKLAVFQEKLHSCFGDVKSTATFINETRSEPGRKRNVIQLVCM